MTPLWIAALSLLCSAQVDSPTYRWQVPPVYIEGEPWCVDLTIEMPLDEAPAVPLWAMTPAAFSINGRPLGKREVDPRLALLPGAKLELSFDLGRSLAKAEQFDRKSFRVAYGLGPQDDVRDVVFLEAAEKGIVFLELPAEQLRDYDVVLRTTQGDIWLELWPGDAPNHVRSFLDLCYTGFYDGTRFHRVRPTFWIQGGSAKPGRPAPRTLNAELNSRRHVAGVLSMARLDDDINSATCEFFIMHGVAPSLDGQYTAFGRVVKGMEVVERIAQAGNKSYEPEDPRSHVPPVDQVVTKAIVVKAPKNRPTEQKPGKSQR
jgi:cyclophilin family peptidyl-prolyl cis-trans isomerase